VSRIAFLFGSSRKNRLALAPMTGTFPLPACLYYEPAYTLIYTYGNVGKRWSYSYFAKRLLWDWQECDSYLVCQLKLIYFFDTNAVNSWDASCFSLTLPTRIASINASRS